MNLRTTIEGRSIAILQSEGFEFVRYAYLVHRLTAVWREHGATVFNLFGVKNFVPADLVFVHVDLSCVPQAYQDFAGRYPRQINMDAVDIKNPDIAPTCCNAQTITTGL